MFYKIIFIILLSLITSSALTKDNRVIIASTTSTYDTGLLDYINKEFNKTNNFDIHVLSLGTGQAIETAKNGDVDILLVHHKKSELEFIKEGYGIKRHKLMYNEFVIIGPKFDKDKCDSINNILLKIKNNKYIFISRGDQSGTHNKEKELWNNIKLNPINFSEWYKKIGQGMGAALFMANELKAYTLTDRATWIAFNNKENLKIICENKPPLINQYSIIAVNKEINPKINSKDAKIYLDWIISDEGKKIINKFRQNNEQLFFFNHH